MIKKSLYIFFSVLQMACGVGSSFLSLSGQERSLMDAWVLSKQEESSFTERRAHYESHDSRQIYSFSFASGWDQTHREDFRVRFRFSMVLREELSSKINALVFLSPFPDVESLAIDVKEVRYLFEEPPQAHLVFEANALSTSPKFDELYSLVTRLEELAESGPLELHLMPENPLEEQGVSIPQDVALWVIKGKTPLMRVVVIE